MRIDGLGIYGAANGVTLSERNRANVTEASERANLENMSAGAVYDRSDSVETDFGGYNRFGRLNSEPASRYAVGGVADILKTDEGSVRIKMSSKGIEPEDLINPDKTAQLSDEPATQARLTDYAMSVRNGIMAQTGMNDGELNDFVNSLMERTQQERRGVLE